MSHSPGHVTLEICGTIDLAPDEPYKLLVDEMVLLREEFALAYDFAAALRNSCFADSLAIPPFAVFASPFRHLRTGDSDVLVAAPRSRRYPNRPGSTVGVEVTAGGPLRKNACSGLRSMGISGARDELLCPEA